MGPAIIITASVSIMAVIAAFQARDRRREGFVAAAAPLVDSLPRDDDRRAELGRYLAPDAVPKGARTAAPWARDSVAFRDALLRRLQPHGAYTIAQFRVLPSADPRRASATRTEAVIFDPQRLLGFHVYNDWQDAYTEGNGRLYLIHTDVRGTVSADVLTKKEVDWSSAGASAQAAAFDETRPVSTLASGAALIRTCSRSPQAKR